MHYSNYFYFFLQHQIMVVKNATQKNSNLITSASPDNKSPTYAARPLAEPLHCSVLHSIFPI